MRGGLVLLSVVSCLATFLLRDAQNQTSDSGLYKATASGVCMYDLPAEFNVGLKDSKFRTTEPDFGPKFVSANSVPDAHFLGSYATNQFSLEAIFYTRFVQVASHILHSSQCKAFYLPYFVSWETSAVAGQWLEVDRPEMDDKAIGAATHIHEKPHFIVMGRTAHNMRSFLERTAHLKNLIKFTIENTYPDKFSNVVAVPYPTWFHYDPTLDEHVRSASASARLVIQQAAYGYNCNHKIDVNNYFEALSSECSWKNSCSTSVAVSSDPAPGCQKELFGRFQCVDSKFQTSWAFKAGSGCGTQVAASTNLLGMQCGEAWQAHIRLSCDGHTVGPCWLSGSCTHKRPGALVSFAGSVKPREVVRTQCYEHCRSRPNHCALYDTGLRADSSDDTFFENKAANMYKMILASTFCLQPPGDTPTRKGIFDSLTLGCIPVIFDQNSMAWYEVHLPNWQQVAVFVPSAKLAQQSFNVVDYLVDLAGRMPGLIKRKQQTIADIAYRLQFSRTPSAHRGHDAFEQSLDYVLQWTPEA
mmetsp:Transcript_60323/g.161884  ORF Transcript_60323/g.161884 Transcript_60323/m.161884 type:complete len:528 (+) Transcript_60323:61-1644(+)